MAVFFCAVDHPKKINVVDYSGYSYIDIDIDIDIDISYNHEIFHLLGGFQ